MKNKSPPKAYQQVQVWRCSELSPIKEGINLNQGNKQSIKDQILEKEHDKKTKFIQIKTKKHKNHIKSNWEDSNFLNGNTKGSLSLKHISRGFKFKNKNSKDFNECKKLSINFKIDQSNSSL